jgi:Fur family peroxide stress response transcriptional regulator
MEKSNIYSLLTERGIRPLTKRIVIYDYLIKKRNHPTVELIHKELLLQIPTLSKTTVYNVLNLFVDKGVVQALDIEGNELRYDADTSCHGHFKCTKCGEVFDFEMDSKSFPELPLEGFLSEEVHYYIKGNCAICRPSGEN